MSEHTSGPCAKTCGCHMEPVADDRHEESDLCSEAIGTNDGCGWIIEYCPLHAAAPELLAALDVAVMEGAETDCLKFGADSSCGKCWVCKAHAAIAKAKGEKI